MQQLEGTVFEDGTPDWYIIRHREYRWRDVPIEVTLEQEYDLRD